MMTLDGKKTYITAVVVALASFAMAMGWLSQEQYQVILGLLGSLGLAALRAGVSRGAAARAMDPEPDEAAARSAGANPAAGVGGNG
jgi:hypothetical protein